MACELCGNIMKYERITAGAFKGGYYPPKNQNAIVYDPKNNVFDIWSDGGGDCFQAGTCIVEINYCPKCGKKLKGDEE